jgi:hypothetical protein
LKATASSTGIFEASITVLRRPQVLFHIDNTAQDLGVDLPDFGRWLF